MARYKGVLPGIAGFACLLSLYCLYIFNLEEKLELYDPMSFGSNGLSAIRMLLEKEGFRCAKAGKFLGGPGDLWIVSSFARNLPAERKRILSWVKSGGTVVELARMEPCLDPFRNDWKKTSITGGIVPPKPGYKPFQGLKYVLNERSLYTRNKPFEGYYGSGPDHFIYLNRYGRGNVVSWNDPGGITNDHVAENPDNAVIFAMLVRSFARGRAVRFYRLKLPGKALKNKEPHNKNISAILLLLAGAGILLWKSTARFGRPRPLILTQGRALDEFVYSLAALFQQAGMRAFILDNLWKGLLIAAGQAAGLNERTDPEKISRRLSAVTGRDFSARIARTFADLEAFRASSGKGSDFLQLAVRIDRLRKEIRSWKK
ncbi:MAG: hypothetical protein ACM3WV_03965 [Bacillota bacterium]